MDKIELGQGFNVLPHPKYLIFMDVFCKGNKFQLFNIANQPEDTISKIYVWHMPIETDNRKLFFSHSNQLFRVSFARDRDSNSFRIIF